MNKPRLEIASKGRVRLRFRFEHQHFLYGDYLTLLGDRNLTLYFGSLRLEDKILFPKEQDPVFPRDSWPEAFPEKVADTNFFSSAPNSLHLFRDGEEGHAKNEYFALPERKVRYGTKVKITFWYYISGEFKGDFAVRVIQNSRDEKLQYCKTLSEANFLESFHQAESWVKVTRTVAINPETTHVSVAFSLEETEKAEVWVDSPELVTLGATKQSGP